MAAAVITKILRGFLRNLPKGEATKLAREHGFVTEKIITTGAAQKHPAATRKAGPSRRPATEHDYLVEEMPDPLSKKEPKEVIIEEIDFKGWEKAGFPGVSEHATQRLGVSKQRQRSYQSDLKEREALARVTYQRKWGVDASQKDITDFIGPPTEAAEVIRRSKIEELARISPAQRQLLNFGRKLSTREIIESAIREGVYNPVVWNRAGLPPWPKELQSPRAMARVALDIPPAKAFTKENQEAIAKKAREIIPLAVEQAGESGASLAKRANLPALREVRRSQVGSPAGRGVRAVNVEDYGTKIYERGDRPLSALTDEDIVSEGYRDITKGLPVETRDEFGHLLSEFKEWGPVHNQRKRLLRNEEQAAIREGKLAEGLPEEEMDDLVRDLIDRDPLYGRPFGQRFRVHVPFEGEDIVQQAAKKGQMEGVDIQYIKSPQRGQLLRIPQNVPPTKQDVTRLMRGEEDPSEIALQKYTEYADEDIAQSLGMTTEDMPTFRQELVTQPTQELSLLNKERRLDKIFEQPISGVPQIDKPHQNTLARVLQDKRNQTEREQFAAAKSVGFKRRFLLGKGGRNEAFAYGEPTAVIPPRVAQQLDRPIMREPTSEVAADLRNRAAEIRKVGNKFRAEANEKIRGAEFQTSPALQTEYRPEPTGIARYKPIGSKTMTEMPTTYRVPDVSPQERKDIWREIRSRPEYMQYKQAQAELKREIGVKAPDMMEFETYTRAPRTRLISRDSVPSLSRIKKASGKEKKLLESNRKLAISHNKFLDESDAAATGFIKKDGTPDIAAWKKAGKPARLDWEDKHTDKLVKPKQKLVDSFKKGRKIVNRKRGGLIKKPRGWGAARYKCN